MKTLENEFIYFKWRHIEDVIAQKIEMYRYHFQKNEGRVPEYITGNSKELAKDFIQQAIKDNPRGFMDAYEEAWNTVPEEFKNKEVNHDN